MKFLLIAIGGAVGSVARYGTGTLLLGYAVFIGTLVWIATFPVSISV